MHWGHHTHKASQTSTRALAMDILRDEPVRNFVSALMMFENSEPLCSPGIDFSGHGTFRATRSLRERRPLASIHLAAFFGISELVHEWLQQDSILNDPESLEDAPLF